LKKIGKSWKNKKINKNFGQMKKDKFLKFLNVSKRILQFKSFGLPMPSAIDSGDV